MFSNKKDAKVSFVLPGKRTIVSAKASKRSRCNYFDDVSNNDNNGSDDDELGAVTSLLDPEDSGETPRAATQPDSESGDVVEAKKSRPRKDVVSQHLLDDDVACLYEDVPQPTSSDVLIGPQHGELISCEGTEKLRRSIVAASMKYRACKNYMEKVAVISDIMDSVKMQNPNGRFLKLDASKQQCWIEVSDEYACMHVLKLLLVTSDKPAAATDTNHQDDATSNNGKPLLSTAEKASGRVSSAVIEAAIRASEKDHEEIHEATLFQEDELYMLDGVPIVEALCQRTIADKNEEATTASAAAYANGAETESDRAGPPQQPTNSTNDTVPSTSADLNRSFDIGLDIDSNGDNEDDDDEEQVLVDLALFNYETFYGLEHGTATLDRVAASSAGILGWAACTLPVVSKQKDDFAEKGEPQFSHSCDAEQPPTLLPPGDDEEARQIQMALLESLLGAHPNHETDTCEYNTYEPEETTSTYDYEDDNTSSSNESDASNSIETAGIAATADEKEDVKVALDTTPAAKSCPAAFSRNKKINKSSWQFQEVLKQVKCRGEATWDSNKGSKDSNINSGPVRNSIASQQDEGVLAREPSNANNEASKRQTDTPSSDTDSWSEVSIGDTNKCDSTQKRCGKKTDTTDATLSGDWHWEVVGASDEDDDWSTGS